MDGSNSGRNGGAKFRLQSVAKAVVCTMIFAGLAHRGADPIDLDAAAIEALAESGVETQARVFSAIEMPGRSLVRGGCMLRYRFETQAGDLAEGDYVGRRPCPSIDPIARYVGIVYLPSDPSVNRRRGERAASLREPRDLLEAVSSALAIASAALSVLFVAEAATGRRFVFRIMDRLFGNRS